MALWNSAYRRVEQHRPASGGLADRKDVPRFKTKPFATSNSPAQAQKRVRNIPAGHGETILIVDDEAAMREVINAILSKSGYNTLVASDGSAALELFIERSAEIDVVVTDLMMPAVNGLLLVQVLRKITSKTKVIICSGQPVDDRAAQLRTVGVQGYLAKPYTQEALLCMVDRVLHELF
jgi:two-component system cell cycle sensor histidine kinase/response regulator CckA